MGFFRQRRFCFFLGDAILGLYLAASKEKNTSRLVVREYLWVSVTCLLGLSALCGYEKRRGFYGGRSVDRVV